MILSHVEQDRQGLSDRIDGGLPSGADEEMRAQGGSKGRFYASKNFVTDSIFLSDFLLKFKYSSHWSVCYGCP